MQYGVASKIPGRGCTSPAPIMFRSLPFTYIHRGIYSTKGSIKPFRFKAAWVSHNQFENVVKENWRSYIPLVPKLTKLATTLSAWNKEVFGNLFCRKRKIWARIEGIQRSLDTGAPHYLLKLERRL